MNRASLLTLAVGLALCLETAQYKEQQVTDNWKWNYREGVDKVNIQGVRSVSRVLDHWGNRIFNTVRDSIISRPQDILPDYSRVKPLSEALDDLFREVKTLKKHLLLLNERLQGLEVSLAPVGFGKPTPVKRVVMRRVPQGAGGKTVTRRIRFQPGARVRGPHSLRRRRQRLRQPSAAPHPPQVSRKGGLAPRVSNWSQARSLQI